MSKARSSSCTPHRLRAFETLALAMASSLVLVACPRDTSTPADSDSGEDASANDASSSDLDASTPGQDAATDPDAGSTFVARLIVLGPDGHAASVDVASPWTVRATTDLGAPNANAQCRGSLCLVVHPTPTDTVDLVDATTLEVRRTFTLAAGADPRDAAWIDDQTAIVTQYGRGAALAVDIDTALITPIDLEAVSDDDARPEAERVTTCGRRAYVQLARIDHESGAASKLGAGLAVIDFDLPALNRLVDVDPVAPGVQAIALAGRAEFDMPADCVASRLYVAEPKPLFTGGGIYEVVDLTTFAATEYPFASSAEVGGFAIVDDVLGWRITHTDFGPGASSHLELVGAGPFDTHNTFSGYYVDDLALDRTEDLLFFPDPCEVTPSNPACQGGVHVFHAHSGARAHALPIDVGFTPLEVTIAR